MRYFYWVLLFGIFVFFAFPIKTAVATLPLYNPPFFTFSLQQPFFHGSRGKKQIALTFDADMTSGMKYELVHGEVKSWYNQKIIKILTESHTKATLFLTGMWIELYPKETKVLAKNSLLELANHSYSHPSFFGRCYGLQPVVMGSVQDEIEKTQKLLKKVTGIDNYLFRFPGGCYSQEDLTLIKHAHLAGVQWDVVGEDGFNEDTHRIEENVVNNVENGSIIVLHMNGGPNSPKTADALPYIITQLKAKGFEFVKVSDLLNQKNISQKQVNRKVS